MDDLKVFSQHVAVRRKQNGDFQAGARLKVWAKLPGHDESGARSTELTFTGIGNGPSVTDATRTALNHANLLLAEFRIELKL